MPVAYLITSYKLPEQVLRLVSLLREGSPDARIFVHHDDRRISLDDTGLKAHGVGRIVPPSPVAWGEASQLAMLLRSMRWMLDRADFEWLVSLSGQDYPIRPVPQIEQSLMTNPVDGFIETRKCDRPALGGTVDEFAGRYHFRWRRVPRAMAAPLGRAGARAGSLVRTRTMPSGHWVGVRALRSPFDARLVCYSGSDWFTRS